MNPKTEALVESIKLLGETGGRIEKGEILRDLINTELGGWVVKMTYNPFITFGIKPPLPNTIDNKGAKLDFTREVVEDTLMKLARRDLSGTSAREAVEFLFEKMTSPSRNILWRVLSKDLKVGVGMSTIQSVDPDLVPSFAVMRAQTYQNSYIKSWPKKAEFKMDGQRNAFVCKDGSGAFFTRTGKHVPALDYFVPNLLKVGWTACGDPMLKSVLTDKNGGLSFMLDGEAMMGLFEKTGALRRKDEDAIGAELHLYDIMPFDDFNGVGSLGEILSVRRKWLEAFVRIAKDRLEPTATPNMIQISPQYYVNSDADVQEMFEKARTKTLASFLARGDKEKEQQLLLTTIDKATGKPKVMEGLMVKDQNGLYDKKKSRGWLKIKAEETEDLQIIGAYPGDPGTKYENCLGGVIMNREGVQVRCGGGFSDLERETIWAEWLETITPDSVAKFMEKPKRGSGYIIDADIPDRAIGIWGRWAEIEFNEITPDGSLRHPRFLKFRDDKEDEVSK